MIYNLFIKRFMERESVLWSKKLIVKLLNFDEVVLIIYVNEILLKVFDN